MAYREVYAAEMELYAEVDIWAEVSKEYTLKEARMMQQTCISKHRAHVKKRLHEVNRAAGYGARLQSSLPDAMEAAIQLVNAEIVLGRTAFPDQPLHVIKVDRHCSHKLRYTITISNISSRSWLYGYL